MNRAEITEVKKLFFPDRHTIDRICGCYVNHEKKKLYIRADSFSTVPDEEMYKYLDVFRHVLSGKRGKNLIDLNFPHAQQTEGGTQDFLLRLRASGLQDDVLLDMFYDRIIDTYDFGENYYIVLVHAVYDVPGKASDNTFMEDASDNVYDFILCAICPVMLSKAALGYNEKKNRIEDRFRDWVVDMPAKGFLFPAFHDRTADIHNMLYYTKKADDIQPDLVEQLFGAQIPLSAPEQMEGFKDCLQRTLGEDTGFEVVKELHEQINRKLEEHDDTEAPLTFDKGGVKKLLADSGLSGGKLKEFDKHFAESFHREDYPLLASNIANTSHFEMKAPDVRVIVNPDRSDLVETRLIDGRPCLVIAIDNHLEVNGINVRAIRPKTSS